MHLTRQNLEVFSKPQGLALVHYGNLDAKCFLFNAFPQTMWDLRLFLTLVGIILLILPERLDFL